MFRRYYDRFNQSDPMTRFLLLAALILGAVVLIPRLPGFGSGVSCEDLPRALVTGSNQSILGRAVDPGELTLELSADSVRIIPGSSLVLWLRFNNASIAPITLLIKPEEYVLRYTGQEAGINFSVLTVAGQVLGESAAVRPPFTIRQQFDNADLRVLGPRSRCAIRIEIPAIRLNGAGMGQGEYRITGVYRNTSAGGISQPTNERTPTPVFSTQGVWVGEIRSNEIVLSIAPNQ